LQGLGIDLLSLDDVGHVPAVDEDASSLEGNALKKAAVVFRITGLASLADDTGLEVSALGGAPGVLSARYAGPECDAAANRKKLLADLTDVVDRSARFRTVVALVSASGTLTFDGTCEGRILRCERGSGGFGYDALFVPSGFDVTFAEMEAAMKNGVSHRGQALRKLRVYLETITRE